MKEETKLIQNILSDPLTGAISTPIYQTSTYVQEAPGVHKGFDYTRTNNPTRKILEDLITHLEYGYASLAFSSGLASVDAILKLLESGSEIVAVDDIYGGTFRLLNLYKKLGINTKFVDTTDAKKTISTISNKTKLVWLESPTNPTLKVSDIEYISKESKKKNSDILVVVDNTFASPVIQNPLKLGSDIVVHSATKYLAGHSDVLAGLITVKNTDLYEKLKYIQNATGGVLSPIDSWLTIRGSQTLYLRIKKQSQNAFQIASFLNKKRNSEIDQVFYPGLSNHKNHFIAVKQQRYFGGIVSFSLKKNTIESAKKVVTSTKIFKLAESLGGTKSLICHPATMTHKSTPTEVRINAGIQNSLIRLSIGIENVEDLIKDIDQALKSLSSQ
ncbi:PLP-dependent aspartate aminotransferase family protein [Blattabacterium sp. (Blaberus giganteus)]|uniref:trans-sulfuration enzyme family protein n=1 Tax=Blattabacterium sp. (Blaberus giganteus) TaxID=1186051 RepID=UPI00025F6E3D|nr:PLP-dependent aspartate aminotransferase family protein [Blattabacterium sp. (Blaberus giganteus)]AFJ90527.1 cystathionine gamma-synthase/cystathionine beta-lyase [Blattabacterium sp. (Blaberus giganteus)]